MKNKILIFTITILLNACDLFTTRDAEDPNQNRSNFVTPSSASLVIQNLKNSLADKNVQNYLSCFVDTLYSSRQFSFSASSEALIQFQMQDWGKDEEQRYFNAVINKVNQNVDIQLALKDTIYSSLGGDSAIYSANYDLTVPFANSNTIVYSGNLEFKLLRDERSLWSIYFWKDTKGQVNPSWSELKGSYY
jgi:hypothetical protein